MHHPHPYNNICYHSSLKVFILHTPQRPSRFQVCVSTLHTGAPLQCFYICHMNNNVSLKWAQSLSWWFVIQAKRRGLCVCSSSLQCPVPVDPAVCPWYRGASAAVCVWRPLYPVGPGAKHALVSGLRAGQDIQLLKNKNLERFFWNKYTNHNSVNPKCWHPKCRTFNEIRRKTSLCTRNDGMKLKDVMKLTPNWSKKPATTTRLVTKH